MKNRSAVRGSPTHPYFRTSILLLAFALVATAVSARTPNTQHRTPNLLFVIADQWRAEAFGYAGNRDVRTPNLDRFARESCDFNRAVASVPVCCPTRASLLTGQRALTHGVFMNDVPLNPKAETLAKVLDRAGYDTGYIGKWHLDGVERSGYTPPKRRQGFRYWKALDCSHDYNHSAYYADTPEKRFWDGYDAIAQTKDAISYLKDPARTRRPFALVLAWGPPHEPYGTAPERYRAMYDAAKLSLRPNVPPSVAERTRKELAGYYAHCTALDDCFEELRQALRETGLEENTIVVFTSDHGDMLGSHDSQKKQQPYDESARVPFLLRWPAGLGAEGRRLSAPLVTEDLMPTLLGLARLRIPRRVEGLDYSGYLRGGSDPSDGAALVLCPAPFGQWSRKIGGREYRAVRTERYTYAEDLTGPWLMFDNERDPYQMEDLAGRPEYGWLQAKLERLLKQKLRAADDEFLPAGTYFRRWGYRVDGTGTVPFNP